MMILIYVTMLKRDCDCDGGGELLLV